MKTIRLSLSRYIRSRKKENFSLVPKLFSFVTKIMSTFRLRKKLLFLCLCYLFVPLSLLKQMLLLLLIQCDSDKIVSLFSFQCIIRLNIFILYIYVWYSFIWIFALNIFVYLTPFRCIHSIALPFIYLQWCLQQKKTKNRLNSASQCTHRDWLSENNCVKFCCCYATRCGTLLFAVALSCSFFRTLAHCVHSVSVFFTLSH